MDIRDVLLDGVTQLNQWLDQTLEDVTTDQMNWLPDGKSLSIGFNAWHVLRTEDNITNFVMQRKPPVWMEQNYFEKFGLPKVDQGTGMGMDDARAIQINDKSLLMEYSRSVAKDAATFLQSVPLETLEEVQMIKPLGEMPRWRVFRQVIMTHGFMHLGEINGRKGQLGLGFFL